MNSEQKREYERKYYQNNLEQCRKYCMKYRQDHREQIREHDKKRYQNHKEQRKEQMRKKRRKLHDRVIDLLGGKCVGCGITDKRILQINHKDGGGAKEYKKIGTNLFYRQILNGKRIIEDLDVRCANCNILYKWKDVER